jgi:hypothetical protein
MVIAAGVPFPSQHAVDVVVTHILRRLQCVCAMVSSLICILTAGGFVLPNRVCHNVDEVLLLHVCV